MTITTKAGLKSGLIVRPDSHFTSNLANAAASPTGQLRAVTSWYSGGRPGASTANSAGVNGQAVTPSLGATVAKRIPRQNPTGGALAYLAAAGVSNRSYGAWGCYLILDRLWHNSGLSTTLTSLQSITPATLPARDRNASTNGADVIAGIEWSGAGGAGTPTATLTYTDQDGNTGITTTLASSASPAAGVIEFFPWAAGDTGIRAPTGFQWSATHTSGTFHLVLFRVVAVIPWRTVDGTDLFDALNIGMPRLFDDSVLQVAFMTGSNNTNTNAIIRTLEAQG
jgi:hypothetical protein